MGEKISEIKANGELRTKKDVSENLFVNDNVILDNCEDTLSSNDGSYLVKSLTRNVVTKYTCAVECHNSSIVVTTTTSAPSTTTTAPNATNATTTTSASPVASYVCAIVSDCPASNRSVEYVESNSCTSSNNTFCDNSVEYEFVKLVKEDGSDISNLVARNGGDGTISCEISRLGGDILSVDGNNQASGTLLNIKADKLQNGIGMHIHNMENDTLTSGSLLQVSTKTSSPENGVVRVNSNNVKSGKIISIEADALTSGNAIEVSNKGNGLTTGSLLNLESFATASDSGIVRVNSNNVKSGKIISIEANALTSGNAIEVTNNGENLTTGSLLHLNSLASNAQNGIANVVGNNVQDGSIVSIEGNSLTTGSLLNLKSHSFDLEDGAVKIDASKMTKGKGIVLDLSEMTEGTGIEMNDNTNLTSGKLLDIRTTSSNALNPVSIAANAITNGKVVEISSDGITSGSTMVLSTNNGDKMINTLMGEKISEINRKTQFT
jgi:hypothetical protein